jgi:hypothetical protein
MLALTTSTEITSVIAIVFVLMALLTFLRLLLRKEEPLWRSIRLGVFIERLPVEDPAEAETQIRPPTTYRAER